MNDNINNAFSQFHSDFKSLKNQSLLFTGPLEQKITILEKSKHSNITNMIQIIPVGHICLYIIFQTSSCSSFFLRALCIQAFQDFLK